MTDEDISNEIRHILMAYKSTIIGLSQAHDEILALYSERLKSLAPTDEEIKAAFASKNFITNVCLSYRHDFALMDESQQSALAFECKEWMRAIVNNWPYREKLTGVLIDRETSKDMSDKIKAVIDRKEDGCHNCSVKDCKIYSSGKKCGNWHGYIKGTPFDEEKTIM